MHKKKSFFVSFEGIEGSGKSYHGKKLFKKVKKLKFPAIYSREPGGSKGAEIIRNLVLIGSKNKFHKITDALLYLASRNEHIIDTLKPAIKKKKVIICDRFIDSTEAYQVNGKGISRSLVKNVHKEILNNIKPDLTFVLKVNISKALKRISKRKKKNRYDKFTRDFYKKVQNTFIRISKKNKKRYILLDNTKDSSDVEKIILKEFIKRFSG